MTVVGGRLMVAAVSVLLLAQGSLSAMTFGPLETLYETVTVQYNWTGAPMTEAEAIASGDYVVAHNIITGVKVYKDMVFVAIPRWRHGVPSTLNVVSGDTSSFVLNPFPNWEWQSRLKYVQSMFVDFTNGVMWVIDTGRQNFFDPDQYNYPTQNGAAALYIFNLTAPFDLIYSKSFPDECFYYNSSFLNDIVVDVPNNWAYMSDTNIAGLGAVVFFDKNLDYCVRFQDPNSTFAEPSVAFVINGVPYNITNPVDGIALSDDGTSVYWSAVQGVLLHRLRTAYLRNASLSTTDVAAFVEIIIRKVSPSDGLMMLPGLPLGSGQPPMLAFGANTLDAVYVLKFSAECPGPTCVQALVDEDNVTMQWIDTFALVPGAYNVSATMNPSSFQYLYFTTNRLQLYFANTMDLSGASGANMRIFRILISAPSPAADDSPPKNVVVDFAIPVVLSLYGLGVWFFYSRRGIVVTSVKSR